MLKHLCDVVAILEFQLVKQKHFVKNITMIKTFMWYSGHIGITISKTKEHCEKHHKDH
jgi:hypothetical protein